MATGYFAGVFNTSPNIQTIKIGGRISYAPIQIGPNFAYQSAAKHDARIQITVAPIDILHAIPFIAVHHFGCVACLPDVHIETDANVIQFLHQFRHIHICAVGRQQKEIIIVEIIVGNVFENMKWFQMIASIGKTDDIFQLEICSHIVGRIDEIFDFIDEMGGRSIECRCQRIDIILCCHHTQK